MEIEGNQLRISGVPCVELADEFGTPQYVYNVERVLENYRRIRDGLEAHADRELVTRGDDMGSLTSNYVKFVA